jgi:hypothetical protein
VGLFLVVNRGASRHIKVGLGSRDPRVIGIAGVHLVRGRGGLIECDSNINGSVVYAPVLGVECRLGLL